MNIKKTKEQNETRNILILYNLVSDSLNFDKINNQEIF